MADTQTTVTNLDIQLLDAERSNATTIKLDNPKNNVTREQVSAAMQSPLNNGWFLCTNGNTAMYLGDITINQSIKTKLGGEDFYVTPATLEFYDGSGDYYSNLTLSVSGATIQGYNIVLPDNPGYTVSVTISSNALSANVHFVADNIVAESSFSVILIIQGTAVTIPCHVAYE